MSVATPVAPALPPRRRRWGLLVAVAAVAVVIGYLAFSSIGSALVYYVTPSELLAQGDTAIGHQQRLGGLVLEGSVRGVAPDLTFVLTDGDAQVDVRATDQPTASFREGSGAVVQGALSADGVFVATEVIVKHDENYEAPPPGSEPSDRGFDPGE